MSEGFDPYRKWLGIPAAEQPPNHYRLLAVAPLEQDPDVIETAADLRMSHLRTYQTGPHSALSQKILNEVAAAKLCLLDRSKKAAYDANLRQRLDAPRHLVAVPIATSIMAPLVAQASTPTPVATAEQQFGYEFLMERAATPGKDGQSEPSAVDNRMVRALSKWRVKPEHRTLVVSATGGIIAGFMLAWLVLPSSGTANASLSGVGRSAQKRETKSQSGAALPDGLAAMLKSIKRPDPLGVVAEKLVIWNAHSGRNNDVGTLECNVRLLAGNREVWSKPSVAIPWAPNEDRNVTLTVPTERFDRVRVEITKWERLAGGLAEIQVLSADGRNVALGCPAIASGVWHDKVGTEHVTDGVTTTAEVDVGAWLLPPQSEGWVEVDLSLPRPSKIHGVSAEKLLIWNQHNSGYNDFGASKCNARLFAGGREVFHKTDLAIPWAPGEDRSLSVALPQISFDRVRLEISKWEKLGGGLAEIEVLSSDNSNLALGCPARADCQLGEEFAPGDVTDGIRSSAGHGVGYWLLPHKTPGWVEIDLACLDAKYGAACRQLGLALALVDGNWQRGLLWLARGENQVLRRLAYSDLKNVYDTPEQLTLADAWWDLAQQAEGSVQQHLWARSLWRYQQAFHKVREFRKAQIQARFDQALPRLPERDYLYFMPEAQLKIDWGSFRETPVSVNGVRSFYGLSVHPGPNTSSVAAFLLGNKYRRLRGAAAMNDTVGGQAATAVTFRILGDGRELWKSRPLKVGGSSQSFDIDVSRADKLELFVDCPGASNWCHAVWVEPRLER